MTTMRTVQTALKRTTGAKNLAAMATDRFTRTLSVDGYARVNPFEVNAGRAPSEEATPHNLRDWEAYTHSSLNTGSQLAITAEGYGEVSLSWTLPTGYSVDTGSLVQRVYWKDMGTSEDLNINPFDTPTGTASAGDGTTHDITGLTTGHFYAIGVKVEWDDSDAILENSDGSAYNTAAGETPLIGGGRGIASEEIFGTTPNFSNLVQTSSDQCFIPAEVNLELTVNLEGPSTALLEVKINAGSFATDIAAVSAGTTTIVRSKASGNNYTWRIRYNDIGGGSPGPFSVERTVTASCVLV